MRSMVGLAGIVCSWIFGESSENSIGRYAGTSRFHLCVGHAKVAIEKFGWQYDYITVSFFSKQAIVLIR